MKMKPVKIILKATVTTELEYEEEIRRIEVIFQNVTEINKEPDQNQKANLPDEFLDD